MKRMTMREVLSGMIIAVAVALGAVCPAQAQQQGAAQIFVPASLTTPRIRALLLYGPGELVPQPDALPTVSGSPIDTLDMSLLEKAFWSRHGLFRATHLFNTHPDDPVSDLRRIARIRRKMLSWHQVLGLATVASMTATVIGGQRAIEGKGSRLHTASLPVTIGLYSTTAALALASPPTLVPDRGGIDTITFHKAFAVLHLAGMILTPMIAPEFEHGETEGDAQLHQIFGYATYGAFTAGMLTVMLFR